MTALTFDDVLSQLYFLDVRVKDRKIIIKNGNELLPIVKVAVMEYKDKLYEYYSDPALLQKEMIELEGKIKSAESLAERYPVDKTKEETDNQISELWKRYYDVIYLRSKNMRKPWVIVKEDEQRCPECPELGKPADKNGIVCEHKCKMKGQ